MRFLVMFKSLFVSFGVIALLLSAPLFSTASYAESNAKLKTAYLYRFAQYVWWPEEQRTIKIAIIGSDNSARDAYSVLDAQAVGERQLSVHHLSEEEFINTSSVYDVVYIASAGDNVLQNDDRWLNTLIVADESLGITSDRIIIQLVKVGTKLRFEINQTAANKANIDLNSRLYSVAHRVYGAKHNSGSYNGVLPVSYQLAYL